MKKITFEAGSGIHFQGGVNFLMSEDGSVYAECEVTEGAGEDYGYITMKNELVKAYEAEGGDAAELSFWYDGQEQYLDAEASADCEVYVEIREVTMNKRDFVKSVLENDRDGEPMTEQRAADVLRWMRNDDEQGTIPADLTPAEFVSIWFELALEAGLVHNEYGQLFQMDAARSIMDDELCEEIHGSVDDDQEFFDEYCRKHLEKYGKEFELAKKNPVW